MNKTISVLLYLLVFILCTNCSGEFLDIKRDKSQAVPTTLFEFQALLDNISVTNLRSAYGLNAIGVDEYEVQEGLWSLLPSPMQKNAYIWAQDVFENTSSDSWNFAYERILYANTVLDGLKDFTPLDNEKQRSDLIKGAALFLRAYTFYQLAQTFAPPYDPKTAEHMLGIPLPLEMDISLAVTQSNLAQTYRQMLQDLQLASSLLPATAPLKFRPTRQAAFALMAKIYMHTEEYSSALSYAERCMELSEGLLDYNTLNTETRYTFSVFLYGENNKEVLYTELIPAQTILNNTRFCIDEELYELYEDSDKRKSAFFFPTRDTYTFKGSYTGSYNFFGGIALDEVVLIRSECYARLGDLEKALEVMNYFLIHRYEKAGFLPFSTNRFEDIIFRIILERRKQLLCRAVRWEDLRRFNKEPAFQTTITRELNDTTYTLLPNDLRYTWPIPDEVIRISGVEQNPR